MSDHRAAVNCGPLPLVITTGAPNRLIQPEKRAVAQSAAVVKEGGTASSQRVFLSVIVFSHVGIPNRSGRIRR